MALLRNECSTLDADGAAFADQLARQLVNTANIEVLPVNCTIRAMHVQRMGQITNTAEAVKILETLGADGLEVGTISAFDAYDPPKIGMAIELYVSPVAESHADPSAVQHTSGGPTDGWAWSSPAVTGQPVTVVNVFLDAADPEIRRKNKLYAEHCRWNTGPDGWVHYRISNRPV